MRILVISQFYLPDITAAAFRIADLVQLFCEEGHEVKVLTAEPHKAQAEGQESGVHSDRLQVLRCPIAAVNSNGARAYIRHYMSFVRGSIVRGMGLWRRGWRPDVVFVTSPPLFAGLSGRFLAALFRRPFIFEVRDIWPDTAVAAGQLSSEGRAYRIGRRLERYLYNAARHISCVSQPMKAYLQGETATPVSVAYNGVMVQPIGPSRSPHVESARRTLLYAGNIGHLQELDLLIRGFAGLVDDHEADAWHIRIIGAGAQRDELQRLVQELRLDAKVSIEPAISRDRAMQEMEASDLLYLNLKRNPTLERTIPSKLFDYMLAARPIVAGLAGEGRDILSETEANVCFEPGDVEQLKSALLDGFRRCNELSRLANRNRDLVLSRFTRQNSARALLDIFEQVSQNTR